MNRRFVFLALFLLTAQIVSAEGSIAHRFQKSVLYVLPVTIGTLGLLGGAYLMSTKGDYDCHAGSVMCCVNGDVNNCTGRVLYPHQCKYPREDAYCVDPVTERASVKIEPISKLKSIAPGVPTYVAGVISLALVPAAIRHAGDPSKYMKAVGGMFVLLGFTVINGLWLGLDQRSFCERGKLVCCADGLGCVPMQEDDTCPGERYCENFMCGYETCRPGFRPKNYAMGFGLTSSVLGGLYGIAELISVLRDF